MHSQEGHSRRGGHHAHIYGFVRAQASDLFFFFKEAHETEGGMRTVRSAVCCRAPPRARARGARFCGYVNDIRYGACVSFAWGRRLTHRSAPAGY